MDLSKRYVAEMLSIDDMRKCIRSEPELVQARDEKGYTLLHFAVTGLKKEKVDLLLQAGADPRAVSSDGVSPLGMTLSRDSSDNAVLEAIVQAGGEYTPIDRLGRAIVEDKAEQVARLLEAHPEYLPQGHPVHGHWLDIACSFGSYAMVRLLLDLGADPNAPGSTPLHRAAVPGAEESVARQRLLLEFGADVNRLDWLGRTAVFDLVSREKPFEHMVEAGVDLNVVDVYGKTVLDDCYAQSYHLTFRDQVEKLRAAGAKRAAELEVRAPSAEPAPAEVQRLAPPHTVALVPVPESWADYRHVYLFASTSPVYALRNYYESNFDTDDLESMDDRAQFEIGDHSVAMVAADSEDGMEDLMSYLATSAFAELEDLDKRTVGVIFVA